MVDRLGRVMPRSNDLSESVLHLAASALLIAIILAASVIYIGKWTYARNDNIGR